MRHPPPAILLLPNTITIADHDSPNCAVLRFGCCLFYEHQVMGVGYCWATLALWRGCRCSSPDSQVCFGRFTATDEQHWWFIGLSGSWGDCIGTDIALPLAFVLGAGYLLWLAYSLYQLRLERTRFRLEMLLLGTVFAIALGVSLLGLVQTALPDKLFYSLYGIAIGLAFFLVQITLDLRPNLSAEVSETVQAAYASSTLSNVDCAAMLSRLEHLMRVDQIYTDADLSLPALAQHLALSSHQLSELMNTRLGKSFSRYLREQRIAAARTMLSNEPSASVLSVGLSVGFTAQSNFYEAFREIEGMTPGQYRKLALTAR
ncbi:AraC-like DNA-binding protein [Silvimonas terrae]|uniref:AraC-like DNA-binding protein n=1 Tax=Silvimonas terrae TaxID=300266 RepID=A0A840REG8_9NEIS|nr:helix-turn-helix domain-containing protein [Silvimonas terrae]MBB5191725.1 AraC-like DNA-binding protein [Silvimonas terrae]